MTEAILAAFVLGPAIIAFLLKSNAALSFLALCAGFVVISFAGSDIKSLTGELNFSISSGILNLSLLIMPLLFTLLFTKGKAKNGFGRALHLTIALFAGVLLALAGVPLLNESLRSGFSDSDIWAQLQKAQAIVVGVGVFLSLVVMWAKNLKRSKDKKKKQR
jgi:divalent metal cation (Fe/Co/Zn/Cd) transporter